MISTVYSTEFPNRRGRCAGGAPHGVWFFITLSIAYVIVITALASCEAPSGARFNAKNWKLHVPVGTAKFEQKDGGFSLNKLSADEVQTMLGKDFSGVVYDGYETIVNTEKRINVRLPDNSTINASEQQTYLIHYPVPMGEDQIKQEMKDNFNAALDSGIEAVKEELQQSVPDYMQDDDGFLEQPPTTQSLMIPVKVNTAEEAEEDRPTVKSVKNLVYDVKLTFKSVDELPKIGNNSIKNWDHLNSSLRNQFKNWVTFDYEDKVAAPAAAVIYDRSIPTQVIWRSPQVNMDIQDGSEKTLIKINLSLEPKLIPPSPENNFTTTRGIKYNPDLEVQNFESITLVFQEGKSLASAGDTEAFASLIKMLGGVEITDAYMYMFSDTEITPNGEGSGIFVQAVEQDYVMRSAVSNKKDVITIGAGSPPPTDIIEGGLSQNHFDYTKFYASSGEQPQAIRPSSEPISLSEEILKKNAPVYEFLYRVGRNTEVTISNASGVDIALLIPLKFKAEAGEDAGSPKLVKVLDESDDYIKLNVEQLDNLLGADGQNEFDLKESVREYGEIQETHATLKIANKILPDKLMIGLTNGTLQDGVPLYESKIVLKDGKEQKLEIHDRDGAYKIPQPSLIIKANAEKRAEFSIGRIKPENAKSDMSVKIVADIAVDLKYTVKF
ncbi:MAG: hypothetical protein LBD20_05900 [Spirochaetaceae bacterium]|jgi:hypothetical protein|nr:hypothetical protein [Spirochaetaceae bacterium]